MKKIYFLLMLMMAGFVAGAQTNPTPQTLPYSQDFSSLAHSSTTYPSGWQGWILSTSPGASFVTTAPTADRTLVANSTAATTSGNVHNYNGKVGFLNTGSSDLSLVFAINTTGLNSIEVSYDAMTIRNPYDGGSNNRINEVILQYRVGTTGSFTNLTGTEYQNNTTTQTTSVTTPQNLQNKSITLPVACENQAEVQLRWASRQVSGLGSRPSFAFDNISVTGTSAVTPDVAISAGGIGASSENQGATDVVLQRYDLAVTSANTTLDGLTVTTAGTYAAADLVNLKVRYSTDNVLDGGDATLSTKTTGLGAGTQVFPSFTTQTINNGTTGYVFVTADISGAATPGNTINIGTTAFSDISFFGTVNKTGTDPVPAAGVKTFAALVPSIAITGVSPTAGNINQNSTNNLLYSVQLDVTVNNATLSSASFTTAGTYQVSDLQANSFKLWINSSNSLTGATQLGSAQAIVASGGSVAFTGLSEVINNGDTRYLLLTTDVAFDGTAGNTISITSTPFSDIVFVSGTKTGTDPVAAGNDQTIAAVTPLVTITQTGPSASTVANGAANVFLYQWYAAVTANHAVLNSFTVNTAGTYAVSDLVANSFKLWYNTVNSFGTATQIGTSQAIVTSGSSVSFSGLAQQINTGATGYFWVTVDIDAAATGGNNINISSTPFANISFATATLSGTDPMAAGGLKTFAAVPAAGEIVINQFNPGYSAFSDEYIELVNKTNKSFDLSLLRISYKSAGGTDGPAGGVLSGTLPPYGYWLLSPNATVTVGLTSALNSDGVITTGFAGTSGQLALQVVSTNAIIDALGYGSISVFSFTEGASAPAPNSPANSGLKRNESDDTNDNSADFTIVPVADIDLRNSNSRLAQPGSTIAGGSYTRLVVKGNSSAGGDIALVDSLELRNGKFTLGNFNLQANDFVGASSSSYVITNGSGALIRPVSAAGTYTFPVGNSTDIQEAAINFAAPLGAANTLAARFIPGDGGANGLPLTESGDNLAKTSISGFWEVNAGTPMSDAYTATFTAKSFMDIISYANVHLLKRSNDASPWVLEGTHVPTTGSNSNATLSRTGMSGFSQFGVGGQGNVTLPVNFADLRAYQSGSAIKVEWSNRTELGVSHYNVERSANGSAFTEVTTQPALKNDGSNAGYSFVDATPLPGVNFYRIRSVETNGKVLYSRIVKVNSQSANMDLVIYPNPVTGNQFSLQLPALIKNVYTIRITNTQGQQVYQRTLNHNGGVATEVIQLPATLKGGYYHLLLTGGDVKLSRSFILN